MNNRSNKINPLNFFLYSKVDLKCGLASHTTTSRGPLIINEFKLNVGHRGQDLSNPSVVLILSWRSMCGSNLAS